MDELGGRGALFSEAVMTIVALKAEVHQLRNQLEEGQRGNADVQAGEADEEFIAALKGDFQNAT